MGFYNVNIRFYNAGDKRWKSLERCLASDIAKAFQVHALDILCLCGLSEKIPGGDVGAWIRRIIYFSAEQSVRVYAMSQYSSIVMSERVEVLYVKLVGGYVPDQPDQDFQHFRVVVGDDREPISIINCHAHASKQQGLTVDERMQTFLACHQACAGDRFIWGGDFNTSVIQLSSLMQRIDCNITIDSSAAHPRSLQLLLGRRVGDVALIHGLRSVQTDSEVGAFFQGASDAHNLLVAKVFELSGWRPARRNAERQSSVLHITKAKPQPATVCNLRLRARTRRVDAIFASDVSGARALQKVLEWISRDFLFGKVANIVTSADGCYEAAVAPSITEKLEEFLRVVEEQRANHLRRRGKLREDEVFNDDDMQEIHKEWINDHALWMNPETQEEWETLRNRGGKGDAQKAHKLRRSAFSAYLFQVIGDKQMLLTLIRYPILCAGQPAEKIRWIMEEWHDYKCDDNDPMETDSHGRRARSRTRMRRR